MWLAITIKIICSVNQQKFIFCVIIWRTNVIQLMELILCKFNVAANTSAVKDLASDTRNKEARKVSNSIKWKCSLIVDAHCSLRNDQNYFIGCLRHHHMGINKQLYNEWNCEAEIFNSSFVDVLRFVLSPASGRVKLCNEHWLLWHNFSKEYATFIPRQYMQINEKEKYTFQFACVFQLYMAQGINFADTLAKLC